MDEIIKLRKEIKQLMNEVEWEKNAAICYAKEKEIIPTFDKTGTELAEECRQRLKAREQWLVSAKKEMVELLQKYKKEGKWIKK